MSILYVVATPIGNLEDFSPRAVQTLRQVSYIAAEDTRHTQKLLNHFSIDTPIFSYHQHNEALQTEKVIQLCMGGKSVALVTDAGTPAVSDPGARVVRSAHAHGIKVCAIPGACSLAVAIAASGLVEKEFYFAGFVPSKGTERVKFLQKFEKSCEPVVMFETPHRILDCIKDMANIFHPDSNLFIGRELSKKFETCILKKIPEFIKDIESDDFTARGEFVLIFEPFVIEDNSIDSPVDVDYLLTELMGKMPLKEAVKIVATATDINKNKLYSRALELKG